jgi:hypothetical protein
MRRSCHCWPSAARLRLLGARVATGSAFLCRFRVVYNGKQRFEVEDSPFSDAGKVGLWTKADSLTLFDDIIYGEAK